MRRFTSVFGLLLLCCIASISLMAAEAEPVSVSQLANAAAQSAAGKAMNLKAMSRSSELQLCTDAKLKDIQSAQATAVTKQVASKAPQKTISTVADLAGNYVMTYSSLTTTGNDGGKSCTITPVEGESAITITNFYNTGCTVKAQVDIANRTITIANQKLGTNDTYGDFDIAVCAVVGGKPSPDRTANVVGSFSPDGNITITSWWGAFVTSGTSADAYFGLFYNTVIEKANATMSQTASTTSGNVTSTYNVVVTQPSTNIINVKNFANYGQTIDIVLNRDYSATIEQQIARKDVTNGDWYTIGGLTFNDAGNLTAYSKTITCDKATEGHLNTISWTEWSTLCTGYYAGHFLTGSITCNDDIVYPKLSVSSFEGEGTEASPYLIKSMDDLILLSDNVNNSTAYDYANANSSYARVYLGQYFRMENDIDMTGYRFTPIGNAWKQRFAGTLDGNGHTVTGLTIKTGAAGYAALVGLADTLAVIKNINFEAPNISSEWYYSAAAAGWCLGTVDNCHVNNGTIYGSNIAVGAVAGETANISNCSATNTTVTSDGGICGGVVGEVDGAMENCFASNTKVIVGGGLATYCWGGVAGELYTGANAKAPASAKNCYFAGTVNSGLNADMYLGGVIGTVYRGTVENCYNTGNVIGYSSSAVTGGVVGFLVGDLKNSYNVGYVYGYSSRRSGGICGYSNKYTNLESTAMESSVTNCYTAGFLKAENYQYDKQNEVRETLGQLYTGSNPTVKNVYFDSQIVDYNSTHYRAMTADLTKAAGPDGFDADAWVFTEGYYPRLKGMEDTEIAKYSASTVEMASDNTISLLKDNATLKPLGNTKFYLVKKGYLTQVGNYSSIVNNVLTVGTTCGTDTLVLVNGSNQRSFNVKISPMNFEGDGSAGNPYLIKSKADLMTLADYTNVAKQYFANMTFKLANDIDMENDQSFYGICSDETDAHCQFAGTIDGDGHAIHNMNLNAVVWSTKPEDGVNGMGTPSTSSCKSYKGFIGRLGAEGTVKNLTIAADCKLMLWGSSGAVVGYLYGTVDNCKNYADVTGYSCWIGGIAGQGTKESTIKNCYNAGNITTGYMNAGGIVGASNGYITNCMNTGDITAKLVSTFNSGKVNMLKNVGGIAGGTTGAVLKDLANAGTVSGEAGIGGLVGVFSKTTSATSGVGMNDMSTSVNYGSVMAETPLYGGAISAFSPTTTAGTEVTTGTVSDVYWDGQNLPIQAVGNLDCNGTTAAGTATLTSGTALKNFDAETWTFTAGSYPVLTKFASEEKAVRASKIYVSFPANETAYDVVADASLAVVDGCAWTLKVGNPFKIEASTLKAVEQAKTSIIDTLVATCGDIVKPFIIKRAPGNPLSGEGTQASPFTISTPAEWNALVAYMNDGNISMDGSFLKITADLDFADTAFEPIGANGATYFQGNLDGNGKHISNIAITTADTYSGAFGVIGENATVSNLTIGGKVTSTAANTGGFAGKIYGQLVNCVNEIDVTSTKASTAGFAARVYSRAKLTDCVNKATVTSSAAQIAGITAYGEAGVTYTRCGNEGELVNTAATAYVGGLVTTCYPATFIECYNTADITASKNADIAGLVAYVNGNSDKTLKYTFHKCYNTGSITGASVVGGLLGNLNTTSTNVCVLEMDSCYNTGDISAISATTVTGSPTAGISPFYGAGWTITDCYNAGSVISQKNTYAAGITGYYKTAGTAASPITIKRCHNSGEIVASGNQGAGIIAYASAYVTVDSCYNTAPVSGGFILAGVVANISNATDVVTNCWNTADITTSSNRAGGVFGVNSVQATVSNCWNSGNVATTLTGGGTAAASGYQIGGIAGQSGAIMTNCYNLGSVTGASQVGGLVGASAKGKTILRNCYNAGRVIAPADTCGNIIGTDLTNGKLWSTGNEVTDCYYVTDYGTYDNDIVGTGKKISELTALDMGSDWTSADNYCFPMLKADADNDAAVLNSAAIVFAQDENAQNVASDFKVGTPARVTWTITPAGVVSQDGNDMKLADKASGTVVLTATCGDFSNAYELQITKTSSIGNIENGKTIVDQDFYNLSGIKVAAPTVKDGTIYIVVKKYDDGTSATVKEIF